MKKLKNRKVIFLSVIFLVCILSSLATVVAFSFMSAFGDINSNALLNIKYQKIPTINSSTSIAFYTIVGMNQTLDPDLRGRFWEFQLKAFTGEYHLEYISDGPLHVNDIEFKVLPNISQILSDENLCLRTPATWTHFLKNYPNVKWYFRGTHDTFVNLTALNELIEELEKKYDPMKEVALAYNLHEYAKIYYPQGGTGWLFSNYAVKQFASGIQNFKRMCLTLFDDVALSLLMQSMNIDVMKWKSDRFICTFPNQQLDVVKHKNWLETPKCPKDGYALASGKEKLPPVRVRTAASIHMHKVPMNEAWDLLLVTPSYIGVTFPSPNLPTFCKLND